jgi:hypothetical protein
MTDRVKLIYLGGIRSNLKRLSSNALFASHVVDSRFEDSVSRLQVLRCRYFSLPNGRPGTMSLDHIVHGTTGVFAAQYTQHTQRHVIA